VTFATATDSEELMKVSSDRVVTLEYKLSTDTGLIESSVGRGVPVAFIHGRGFMLPGLDSRLDGLDVGEKKSFDLPPEEAFGTIEQQQRKPMGRTEFPKDAELKPGAKFQAKIPGSELLITLEVLAEIDAESVEVRLIHPYAGKVIQCEVTVVGVRAATPRELETGVVEAVGPKAGGAPPPPPPGSRESLPELELEPDEE
jgi:FKBP-type peptidyl-prolyl cis-trans isomerase SlyD